MQPEIQSFSSSIPPASSEVSAATFLAALAPHGEKSLVFSYDGRDVLSGYHVTEMKNGTFEALDCGANHESWQETFIQLWDVPADGEQRHMPVAKFRAIIGTVTARVPVDADAKVTFEVSDGQRPIGLYRVSEMSIERDTVRVALAQRPASCKPRDRWLAQQAQASSCCAPE